MRGVSAPNASNAASHAFTLEPGARRQERFVHHDVAGEENAVALDEEPGVAARVGRPDHEEADADASEIEQVLAIEGHVGAPPHGVRQELGGERRAAGERLDHPAPLSSNSDSCTVELTYFALAGNATYPVVCSG